MALGCRRLTQLIGARRCGHLGAALGFVVAGSAVAIDVGLREEDLWADAVAAARRRLSLCVLP
jgi:hypothetical protein